MLGPGESNDIYIARRNCPAIFVRPTLNLQRPHFLQLSPPILNYRLAGGRVTLTYRTPPRVLLRFVSGSRQRASSVGESHILLWYSVRKVHHTPGNSPNPKTRPCTTLCSFWPHLFRHYRSVRPLTPSVEKRRLGSDLSRLDVTGPGPAAISHARLRSSLEDRSRRLPLCFVWGAGSYIVDPADAPHRSTHCLA